MNQEKLIWWLIPPVFCQGIREMGTDDPPSWNIWGQIGNFSVVIFVILSLHNQVVILFVLLLLLLLSFFFGGVGVGGWGVGGVGGGGGGGGGVGGWRASPITSPTIIYSTVYSRRRSKKTSKLRVTGLCAGNSPVTGEFPAQRASNAENVSIWWRHHVWPTSPTHMLVTRPRREKQLAIDWTHSPSGDG